jgi:hypothetical protein
MAFLKVKKRFRERYPRLNFYGVKVENLQVTKKFLYVKAHKKGIQKDFQETYDLDKLKKAGRILKKL